jgi:hypothetical protein
MRHHWALHGVVLDDDDAIASDWEAIGQDLHTVLNGVVFDDAIAIASDWEAIGQDLHTAIRKRII